MKKFLGLVLLLSVGFQLHSHAQDASAEKGAEIRFEEVSHDFGDIQQGDKVQYIFKFKNTGSQALLISEVVTTCGCTAPSWSKEPVLPGQTGEIHITFNSTGKMGRVNKGITVLSNATNNPSRLGIVCNVLPKKE